jgi:hypothetical protein
MYNAIATSNLDPSSSSSSLIIARHASGATAAALLIIIRLADDEALIAFWNRCFFRFSPVPMRFTFLRRPHLTPNVAYFQSHTTEAAVLHAFKSAK